MKSSLDMKHFAAIVKRYTTPLLEDSMGNEKEGCEVNTKHTPEPRHMANPHGEPYYEIWHGEIGEPDRECIAEYVRKANAVPVTAVPNMITELARGRAALCALRYWVPEDLLPAVNRVIVDMAHAIIKATGDCPPEADGRTEKAARAAIEEAAI